jgi:hypothetical protein
MCGDVLQESEALNLYKEALALRLKKDFQTALQTFHQTLALPYVENVNTRSINHNMHLNNCHFLLLGPI